ncbi:hypothetical protein PspS34_15715 [Pseudomonas sp. S34]|uniref:DnaT-like ssDNA-binding domain-containing protein n=1 Tax=Pseudomonas sp. S34 TaxID=1573718 RepID=UPI00132F3FB0|nr:DnaT-like ssDNA-binding domain-containing protein [Pseudomonas sp. S34]QHF39624.1 hypothetical protein PspS34_15715 [Pseudomonas sp. S34]
MAGDWIKFELTTLDKPEVCQIADLADIDPDAVVGKLMRVWGWFDQQTESGNAPSVSKKLLDRLVGVIGFCEHMKSVAWMQEVDGVISLPHFERHNGKTAKNRLLTAKRVANHKAANAKGNVPSVSNALPKEDGEKNKDQHNTLGASDRSAAVEMSLEWVPDQQLLQAYALRMALPLTTFSAEATAAFVCHYTASGRFETQAAWVSLLVKWIKRDVAKTASSNIRQFPVKQVNGPDFDDTTWSDDLGDL